MRKDFFFSKKKQQSTHIKRHNRIKLISLQTNQANCTMNTIEYKFHNVAMESQMIHLND